MSLAASTSRACSLKSDILRAGRFMVQSRDFRPANDKFHEARYKLFEIAGRVYEPEILEQLWDDADLRALSRKIFHVSCQAGVEEERATARTLLARANLSFEAVYESYFGEIYETLMRDELDWFAARAAMAMADQKIAYIGGGAMPLPAILMARLTGCRISIVDPDFESCRLASDLVARVGLADRIEVVNQTGEAADYTGFTMAWIANWIESKRPIFERLHYFPGIRYVVARSATENSLSFLINDPLDCHEVCPGFLVRHTTRRREGLSLVSIVLENNSCHQAPEAVPVLPGPELPRTAAAPVVDSMTDLIGNTPLLRLDPAKTGLKNIELFAKLEHLNPFGSIKDRTALGMLGPHISRIAAEGKDVIELSSGNAARGLQAIASIHGVTMETISNRIRVPEMRKALQIQGARITPLPEIDPNDAYAALHSVDDRAKNEADLHFYTDQYRNPGNVGAHSEGTAGEILDQIGAVDFFVGAIGTAGSSVGISRRLRQANPALDVTGVVSDKEDFIPGIRHQDEIFDVGPFRTDEYDRIVGIRALKAIDGVLRLVREFGVMAGPSSGAAFEAALAYLKTVDATLQSPKKAVFLVCDRVELYLSYIEERRPDLFR